MRHKRLAKQMQPVSTSQPLRMRHNHNVRGKVIGQRVRNGFTTHVQFDDRTIYPIDAVEPAH